jgi:hypothetical protein
MQPPNARHGLTGGVANDVALGGRYIFLTNDSGVGGDPKEPSIPCYFVTRLDHAILRMVQIEMRGDYSEPNADEILRTGGNPQNGACELESGQVVTAF